MNLAKCRSQIISDWHMEHYPYLACEALPNTRLPIDLEAPPPVVFLAGDMCSFNTRFQLYHTLSKPQFEDVTFYYVLGNHEFYGKPMSLSHDDVYAEFKATFAPLQNVKILENEIEEIYVPERERPLYVAGATLWTNLEREQDAQEAKRCMNDFRVPGASVDWWSHKHTYSSAYLRTVAQNLKGKADLIVLTHFLPHSECVHPKWRGNALTPAFMTPLDWIDDEDTAPLLWIHGHTHDPVDYTSEVGTRFLCNPRGYPGEMTKEPARFNPSLILEI